MTVETMSKENAQAVQFFENKLAFEMGPVGLHFALKDNAPVQIIDLRTPELYAAGHIPGAVNISYEDLESHLHKLDKDKITIVYCYDILCNLSAKAALLLAQKGYRVKELSGGFAGWTEHEFKVQSKTGTSGCATSKTSCG